MDIWSVANKLYAKQFIIINTKQDKLTSRPHARFYNTH